MAVISIQYKEFSKAKNLFYKSVSISYDGLQKKKTFKSKNFVKDWYDCIKFCLLNIGNDEFFCHSSSVNHFIMDGAPYDSAYLKVGAEHPELIYSYDEDAIELFVPKGTTPTWEELKKMCETKKKGKIKK